MKSETFLRERVLNARFKQRFLVLKVALLCYKIKESLAVPCVRRYVEK